MAYQRGSLKKVMKKEGLMWVLRYRIGGSEQTPLVIGLVAWFGVHSIGRYGGWTYCSIEDNIVEARALVNA